MKRILTILMILYATMAFSQTGMMMNRFYITGSLVVGKGDRTFADTSCWLQVGKDTTNKGLILPRVVLDSVRTAKRGLFVYDLKDSVLYHFDANKRVRYMTYKDTILIKQIIAQNIPVIDTNVISTRYFVDNGFVKIGGNTTGSSLSIGTNDNQQVNIKTNNTSRIVVANDGAVGVGTIPTTGKLHVSGVVGAEGLNVTNNTTGSYSGINKNATTGLIVNGADGTTSDFTLINNPTNNQTVMSVPHGTNTTKFSGRVEINKASDEVQLDLSSSPSRHLYAGVSTSTFNGNNKGFVSFGTTNASTNTALVFDSAAVSVPNGSFLVGKYANNGVDRLQVAGTIQSFGMKFNNSVPYDGNHYNIIKRYQDTYTDGIEISSGGASGGFNGGFRIKTRGGSGSTAPVESVIINGDKISMGYHVQDVNGNGYPVYTSQLNIVGNLTNGHLLNLWNKDLGSPVIESYSNYTYGSGTPSITSGIVCEADNYSYRGNLSFFTNNGTWGDWASNTRAMLIDGYQNVGIGVSRGVGAVKDGIGLTLPSARLHVLGSNVSTPVTVFQTASSQIADITQWKDNSGAVLAKVDKDGNATVQKLKTVQPSSNGAGEYKFGKVITGSSVTMQTDKFVEVEIDGTIYKLAIVQ